MMFERLRYSSQVGSQSTFTADSVTNEIGLIKAKTVLTFLYDRNLLHKTIVQDSARMPWVVYSLEQNVSRVSELQFVGPTVDLLIAITMSPILTRQLGIAVLRDTLENRSAFANEFMQNTRNWLDRHPADVEELEQKFNQQTKAAV